MYWTNCFDVMATNNPPIQQSINTILKTENQKLIR